MMEAVESAEGRGEGVLEGTDVMQGTRYKVTDRHLQHTKDDRHLHLVPFNQQHTKQAMRFRSFSLLCERMITGSLRSRPFWRRGPRPQAYKVE